MEMERLTMAFDTTVIDDNEVVADVPETPETEVSEEAPEHEETAQTDDTEADETEQPEADETDDDESQKQKPKKGAAARIQQLVAEKKATEAELERLRQESKQPKQAETLSPDGAPVAPKIDDFDLESEDGLEEYFKAQSEYEAQKSEWEFDQKLAKREQVKLQQQREQEITNQFKERFTANPTFKQNFEQLAAVMQDKPINADPSQLYQGEDLMDLLEHVAGDIDLYYEIASLPEPLQYAKFGEIQASIKARKSNPAIPRQSKAPRPPNHTKSNAPISRSDYDKSDDDFLAARGL